MNGTLTSNWNSRSGTYDVVVIGSGYGGAIPAWRIAQAKLKPKPNICIRERGMEWIPGMFPDEPEDITQHSLTPLNPLGLYEYRLFKDIDVIQGSGLGGTSLVNANVAIIPEPAVFEQNPWPVGDTGNMLAPYYERAAKPLDVGQHPRGMDLLKVRALETRADLSPNAKFDLLRIAVNFKVDGIDPE